MAQFHWRPEGRGDRSGHSDLPPGPNMFEWELGNFSSSTWAPDQLSPWEAGKALRYKLVVAEPYFP